MYWKHFCGISPGSAYFAKIKKSSMTGLHLNLKEKSNLWPLDMHIELWAISVGLLQARRKYPLICKGFRLSMHHKCSIDLALLVCAMNYNRLIVSNQIKSFIGIQMCIPSIELNLEILNGDPLICHCRIIII